MAGKTRRIRSFIWLCWESMEMLRLSSMKIIQRFTAVPSLATRLLLGFVIAALLSACTTPRLVALRRGDPVSIVVTVAQDAESIANIRNKTIGQDSRTGAGIGAGLGALWGLGCGPWILLCMPVAALALGSSGAIVGAGVGVIESLPAEKQAQLESRMMRFRQPQALRDALQVSFDEQAKKHWPRGVDSSSAVVRVEMREILLNSMREERIVLVVRVRVSVDAANSGRPNELAQKEFEYVGQTSTLAMWMDASSDFAEKSFANAWQHLAAEIVSELANQ
jgi:hypothetical protein